MGCIFTCCPSSKAGRQWPFEVNRDHKTTQNHTQTLSNTQTGETQTSLDTKAHIEINTHKLIHKDTQNRQRERHWQRGCRGTLEFSLFKPVQMLQKVRHMDVPQKIPSCSTRWQEIRVVCKKSSNTQGRSMSNTLRQASSQIQRG